MEGQLINQKNGVVVPAHSTFNVVEGDYRGSCVGTAICPICGLCGTLLCCNTLSGKHGAAEGCKISMVVGIIAAAIMGILVVSSAINCKSDMTPGNTNYDDCNDISGAYYNQTSDKCYFNGNCPSKYSFKNSTKDGVRGWCENDDHYSCMGLTFKAQPWVNVAISVVFLFFAIRFAKQYYSERITRHQQAPPPVVYGTPVVGIPAHTNV